MINRLSVLILTVSATLASVVCASMTGTAPMVLLNDSPSEPTGFYLRMAGPAEIGTLVAFRTPAASFPYADRHHATLRRHPILKEIAAENGTHVCASSGALVINGVMRAKIAERDRFGDRLPQWRECRSLRSDELFMFSSRIPNSFDSRYYGPVTRSQVIGVYQLILPLALGGA